MRVLALSVLYLFYWLPFFSLGHPYIGSTTILPYRLLSVVDPQDTKCTCKSCKNLVGNYQNLVSDYQNLVGDYQSLVGDYQSLVGDYQSLVGDYQ